jgi:hypothetical protein
MLNYIFLSQTTPCDEPCAQVGSDDYMQRARMEARVYMDQLKRTFGNNPEGSFFKVVRCLHDFGTYLDIRFYYDDEDQTQVKCCRLSQAVTNGIAKLKRNCVNWATPPRESRPLIIKGEGVNPLFYSVAQNQGVYFFSPNP